jgi:hypothetical protein
MFHHTAVLVRNCSSKVDVFPSQLSLSILGFNKCAVQLVKFYSAGHSQCIYTVGRIVIHTHAAYSRILVRKSGNYDIMTMQGDEVY